MLKWTFDTTKVASDGVNDGTLAQFKGNLIGALARESLQNSLDAHDKTNNDPVKVKFKVHQLVRSKVPGLEELPEIFRAGKDFVESSVNTNDSFVKYYERAISASESDNISVLEISDSNTTGLTGNSTVIGSKFYNLVIAEGDTGGDKSRGGSFGFGKGALYNASPFRHIIFSSLTVDGQHAFIGKVKMSSFIDSDGQRTRGVGAYGAEGGVEVSNAQNIPNFFLRERSGLSVFIVGFEETVEWEGEILKRILNDFWLSILQKKLEVDVGKVQVDAKNVGELIKVNFSPELSDRGNYGSKHESPLPSYLAYTKGSLIEKRLDHLGKCKLYLRSDPLYAPKISHFRMPRMLIFRGTYLSASGVQGCFICDDDKGNMILNEAENPEHLEWKMRNVDESAIFPAHEIREALKEMKDFITKEIKQFSGMQEGESIDLQLDFDVSEMGSEKGLGMNYFDNNGRTTQDEPHGSNLIKEEVNLDEIQKTRRKKLPTVVPAIKSNSRRKSRGRKTNKKGREGDGNSETLIELNFRSFATTKNDKYIHTIKFQDKKPRTLDLEFWGATDGSQEKLSIMAVFPEDIEFDKDRIINLDTKKFPVINIEFSDGLKHPLIMKAYKKNELE